MGVSENSVPLNPMVLLIIIPMKNGYFIGNINPTFSDKPKSTSKNHHVPYSLKMQNLEGVTILRHSMLRKGPRACQDSKGSGARGDGFQSVGDGSNREPAAIMGLPSGYVKIAIENGHL